MIVAIVTNNGKKLSHHIALSKKIALYKMPGKQLLEMADNPIVVRIKEEHIKLSKNNSGGRHLRTGYIIPEFLAKKDVNVFVAAEFGEGMKDTLLRLGIKPVVAESDDINEILNKIEKDIK